MDPIMQYERSDLFTVEELLHLVVVENPLAFYSNEAANLQLVDLGRCFSAATSDPPDKEYRERSWFNLVERCFS